MSYNKPAENGQYLIDTVASTSCNSGYDQIGPNSTTCETSGNWNEQTPRCEGFNVTFWLFKIISAIN